jgi:hypothetical protein
MQAAQCGGGTRLRSSGQRYCGRLIGDVEDERAVLPATLAERKAALHIGFEGEQQCLDD